MSLSFLAEKCTGCQLCTVACSGFRSSIFSASMANLRITSRYAGDCLETGAKFCDLCGECVDSCPSEALAIEGKIVSLSRENCSSCGICAEVCPNEVIYMRDGYPVICNLCEGEPWCVKMCPRDAILFNSEVKL